MHQYVCKVNVNGRSTRVTVTANSAGHARQLVEAQYAGQRVTVLETKKA